MKFTASGLILTIGAAALFLAASPVRADSWEGFKKKFISKDGRVIDYLQGQSSHSEGQAYAMLLAVYYQDPELFAKAWTWARDNLQVRRDDKLLAWRWGRHPNGRWSVLDDNNASDGDLLAAWALLLAAERWGLPEYRDAAVAIADSMVRHVVVKKGGRWFLVPGYHGFVRDNAMDLNPSYLVFPALRRMEAFGGPWPELYEDSKRLLAESLFTTLRMPADWVRYEAGAVKIHPERGRRFGYEAIRVPLYLIWDGRLADLPDWNGVLDRIETAGYVPLFFDLVHDNAAMEPAPAGFHAVFARTARELGRHQLARRLWEKARALLDKETDNYYSHVLYLLAEVDL
jgi:endo-1,4-beta-D-glucanase Y